MEGYRSAKELYVIRSHTFLSTLLVGWHQSMLHAHQLLFCKLLRYGQIIVKLSGWAKNFCELNQLFFLVFLHNFIFFSSLYSNILVNKFDAIWIKQMRVKFDRHNDSWDKKIESCRGFTSVLVAKERRMNEDLRWRRACKVIKIAPTLRAKIEPSSQSHF